MKWYEDLVTANPMTIEVMRFRRKYLSLRQGKSAQLILLLIGLGAMALVIISSEGAIDPIVIIMIQLIVVALGAPTLLSGSVAGERENRTWDLLLVAPVTKSQIVVGKFLGAMAVLATAIGASFVLVLVAAGLHRDSSLPAILFAEALIFAYGALICAATILISARVKRPFTALGAVIGLQFMVFTVFPALMGLFMWGVPGTFEITNFLNPFVAVGQIHSYWSPSRSYSRPDIGMSLPLYWGPLQTIIYLALTVVALQWAIATLTFPENDVKFMPKPKVDAGS